jgi:hypothetical protein
MVLKTPVGKPISTAPFFDILGFKVLASWPGSDKACPHCKQVGHDSHSCPRRPAVKKQKKRTPSTTTKQQPATTTSKSPPTPMVTAATAGAPPTSDPIGVSDTISVSAPSVADDSDDDSAMDITASSSTAPPPPAYILTASPVACPFTWSADQLIWHANRSDKGWLEFSEHLKKNQIPKDSAQATFLALPPTVIAASLKAQLLWQLQEN